MTESVRLTDERLAWLAAQDYCAARAKHLNPALRALAVFVAILSVGRSARVRRAAVQQKQIDYGFAVDTVADRLSADERTVLRATRALPAWFYPAVEGEFEAIRRRRRELDG